MEAARKSALSVAVLLVSALTGCRSLDRFDTQGAAAYCGSIVGTPEFHAGFVATNAPPSLGLRLELDTDKLTSLPGALTSNDAKTGFCRADGRPLFQEAPLRAIPELFHDALSQVDLGDGHEQDFFAWVDSSCQGTMLAIVSLLTKGTVELRLLKPAADPPTQPGPEHSAGFALFYLERSEKGCGF